jgi:Ca2+-binding EF-hand superfamily protein
MNYQGMYSDEEIENFRVIFEMFEKNKSGFIEVGDLQSINRSLGRDPHEAIELMQNLDIDIEGKINFEQFIKLMKILENRMVSGKDDDEKSPREADVEERNKYGSLLPRTGVHFLPDSKVVDFLK